MRCYIIPRTIATFLRLMYPWLIFPARVAPLKISRRKRPAAFIWDYYKRRKENGSARIATRAPACVASMWMKSQRSNTLRLLVKSATCMHVHTPLLSYMNDVIPTRALLKLASARIAKSSTSRGSKTYVLIYTSLYNKSENVRVAAVAGRRKYTCFYTEMNDLWYDLWYLQIQTNQIYFFIVEQSDIRILISNSCCKIYTRRGLICFFNKF